MVLGGVVVTECNVLYSWKLVRLSIVVAALLRYAITSDSTDKGAVESPVVFSNEKRASSSSSRAGSDVGLLVVGAGSSLRHSAVSEQELYLIPSAVLLLPSAI